VSIEVAANQCQSDMSLDHCKVRDYNVTPLNGQIIASPTLGQPGLPSPRDLGPNPNWTIRPISVTNNDVTLRILQGSQDILGSPIEFGNVPVP
jgi:hypothetical protein